MGYRTEFEGKLRITPPLNAEEVSFLQRFSNTRRMHRRNGPYFVDGSGYAGQGRDPDVIDFNNPSPGQPGVWCSWTVSDDGTELFWNGAEKFYDSPEWLEYLIRHFLAPGALAVTVLPFLQCNHRLNGTIYARGEDEFDRWMLVVRDNEVTVKDWNYLDFPDEIEKLLSASERLIERIECVDFSDGEMVLRDWSVFVESPLSQLKTLVKELRS